MHNMQVRVLPGEPILKTTELPALQCQAGLQIIFMGAAEGCGVALQASCLEGFDTPGLHHTWRIPSKRLYKLDDRI